MKSIGDLCQVFNELWSSRAKEIEVSGKVFSSQVTYGESASALGSTR